MDGFSTGIPWLDYIIMLAVGGGGTLGMLIKTGKIPITITIGNGGKKKTLSNNSSSEAITRKDCEAHLKENKQQFNEIKARLESGDLRFKVIGEKLHKFDKRQYRTMVGVEILLDEAGKKGLLPPVDD